MVKCSVPRKQPLPAREIEIGRRVFKLRRSFGPSRSYVAKALGFDAEILTRVELGRAPLKLWLADKLISYFFSNAVWLATGAGDMWSHVQIPSSEQLKMPSDALFSEAFDALLAKYLQPLYGPGEITKQQMVDVWSSNALRGTALTSIRIDLVGALDELPDNLVRRFTGKVRRYARALAEKLGPDTWENVLVRRQRSEILRKFGDVMFPETPAENKALTDTSSSGNIRLVKSELKALLARLEPVTNQPGKKTELAEFLKAPLASVSRWLSGDREPGGETALQMLQWVKAEEAKLKSPGSATNTARAKTQLRKSSDEKPKPNPLKR